MDVEGEKQGYIKDTPRFLACETKQIGLNIETENIRRGAGQEIMNLIYMEYEMPLRDMVKNHYLFNHLINYCHADKAQNKGSEIQAL